MIIESKKTGVIQNISKEDWGVLKVKGFNVRFRIIDNSDENVKGNKIPIPSDIKDIYFDEKEEKVIVVKKPSKEKEEVVKVIKRKKTIKATKRKKDE